MHICVDFIAELISQPSLEKQEFAIDLISHLALQYTLPHSMMVARLALNTFSSLLSGKIVDIQITASNCIYVIFIRLFVKHSWTALPSACRTELFSHILPAFVRLCEAFPPLIEDTISLLVQLGKISVSESALKSSSVSLDITNLLADGYQPSNSTSAVYLSNDHLWKQVEDTFEAIISRAVLKTKIY